MLKDLCRRILSSGISSVELTSYIFNFIWSDDLHRTISINNLISVDRIYDINFFLFVSIFHILMTEFPVVYTSNNLLTLPESFTKLLLESFGLIFFIELAIIKCLKNTDIFKVCHSIISVRIKNMCHSAYNFSPFVPFVSIPLGMAVHTVFKRTFLHEMCLS
jgi:hypothetical protein